nr:low-density lipoprotein receptor-related protein 3 isoform X4 [Pogona vitticeps]
MDDAASAELRPPGALGPLAALCLVNLFLSGKIESAVPSLAACSGKLEQHTERRGVIYSPSWPLNYPPAVNCSWYIQGDRGDVITISFKNFDLEDSPKCSVDWLMIGPSSKREEYKVCGSLIPPSFISARDHIWIFFHSDASSSGQAQGFRLSYVRGRIGQANCQSDEFHCLNGKCIPSTWKCNSMDECGDNSDEKNCTVPPTEAQTSICPSGTFQCSIAHSTKCLLNELKCNSVKDCSDGSDEENCPDLSCGKRLGNFYGSFASPDLFHSDHSRADLRCTWAFETQMTRLEAEFVRREAPPSYGQLIAQGLIPPVEDFPVYNASQASVLQNIRTAMRRQMRRHSSRRSSSRRRLGRLWNRFFHRPRVRGQIPLLNPPHTSQTMLGDGIINRTNGTTAQSLPPSPEGPHVETEICCRSQGLPESENSNLPLETEATNPSPPDVLSNTCTAAPSEPENGPSNKLLGAEGTCSGEARQTSKTGSEKFRDPLLERVVETHQHVGSVSSRTIAESRHSSRCHLRSEEPCRLPFKTWESLYSDSPMNVPLQVDGQHSCCPHTYHEEPLGVHPACCHSTEVPIPDSPPPCTEISPGDDDSLLVC